MKKIYNKIIYSNTRNEFNKKAILLNIYTLIWFHLSVLFIITDTIQGIIFKRIFLGHIITIIKLTNLCLIIFLNHKDKFTQAKWLFMLTAFIIFNSSSLIVSPGIYTEYYFFLIPGLSLSLFDRKWILVSFLILAIICFFLPYHVLNIYTYDYTQRIDYPAMISLFAALFLLFNYFKKQNNRNEKLLELEKNRVLSDKIILEQQEKELRELNEFKSHFFVNLSHEIRTPLTLIQGYTKQIKGNIPPQEINKKARIILEQTNQMQSIINNIMDLSKMDTKQFSINTELVALRPLLEKLYSNFKTLYENKDIDFQLHMYHEEVSIKIDKVFFEKAINNLLNNSLKFTPYGGKVVLQSKFEDKGFSISITDSGIGIPAYELSNIFKRFYQVKNHITKSQGSGIGLAFTKSIIDAHHFQIKITSKEDQGSLFQVFIPKDTGGVVKKEDMNIKSTSELYLKKKTIEKVTIPQQSVSKEKPRILVVEDHEHMRNYLKSILTDYHVIEAEHGKDALKLMQTKSFDLILTDYMMPVMNGSSLVEAIKKQGYKTPILILTARTDNHGKLTMLRLGIDGYLHKPFLEEELLLLVKKALQLYRNIKTFESALKTEEKASLNTFAEKFNTKINSYIIQHLNSDTLNVEEIAMHLNMSRSTLNRKTKAVLGQSPKDLIMEARLQKARTLQLENPLATKKEISLQVGVSNTSYLFQKLEKRFNINAQNRIT